MRSWLPEHVDRITRRGDTTRGCEHLMEIKKIEETQAVVCNARELMRRHLAQSPKSPLSAEKRCELRCYLQQLQPCLCILRAYERQHAYRAMYEVVLRAAGQVLESLLPAEELRSRSSESGVEQQPSGGRGVPALSDGGAQQVVATSPASLSLSAPSSLARPVSLYSDANLSITWKGTYGCAEAILALRQATTLPLQYPSLFTGPRKPWRRLLLYGPPGTGKTRLAAATATECDAAFLSISAADLLSKWVGESEKHVRQAFAQAAAAKPRCVLFFDEVDALCSARGGAGESELARRLKTEFLLHLQLNMPTVTVLAATNMPWELDAAFVRRFDRFVYVGLPSDDVKRRLLRNELRDVPHRIAECDLARVTAGTERFSVVDMRRLLSHAAMAPVTELLQAKSFSSLERSPVEKFEDEAPEFLHATAAHPLPTPAPNSGEEEEVIGGAELSLHDNGRQTPSPCTPSSLSSSSEAAESEASRRANQVTINNVNRIPLPGADEVPVVEYRHFEDALHHVTASTSVEDLHRYTSWRSKC